MKKEKKIMNTEVQYYKGIPLKLIVRKSYEHQKAKRYTLNNTNQNVWIPNVYLLEDGTIKPNADLDFVFRQANRQKKFEYANLKYEL